MLGISLGKKQVERENESLKILLKLIEEEKISKDNLGGIYLKIYNDKDYLRQYPSEKKRIELIERSSALQRKREEQIDGDSSKVQYIDENVEYLLGEIDPKISEIEGRDEVEEYVVEFLKIREGVLYEYGKDIWRLIEVILQNEGKVRQKAQNQLKEVLKDVKERNKSNIIKIRVYEEEIKRIEKEERKLRRKQTKKKEEYRKEIEKIKRDSKNRLYGINVEKEIYKILSTKSVYKEIHNILG